MTIRANPVLPETIADSEQLEDSLSTPTPGVIDMMSRTDGNVIILGVAGKMGPTLARMAKRASDEAAATRRVIGVARFSQPQERAKLESCGIETIRGDLLDEAFVEALPDAPNVIYMAGVKFGSTGNEALTWAINTHLPSLVCRRYAGSRIAAFSTGNVYGLVPVTGGGSVETDPLNPQGEYAMSCLGRERIFEHFSHTNGTPLSIIRLNYATELRYGVLVDLAQQVWAEHPIDLTMGSVNVIWQGEASAMSLRSLGHAASSPFVLNVAGSEMLNVQQICEQFGEFLGKPVRFTGEPSSDALLSNGRKGYELFGQPRVTADRMLRWIADWVRRGGESLGKPTHFEVRDGKF